MPVSYCCLFPGATNGSELRSRFARFENTKVHYLTSGKGERALVCVHGWACKAEALRGQSGSFPSQRVITIDLPGHGESDKPHVDYTIDYFARSIAAVMADARIKSAVLIGHSMGAPIVGHFYRLYPEKTLGLVIVDGAMRPFLPREAMERLVIQLRANYPAAAAQMIDQILTPLRDPRLRSEIRAAMLSTPDPVSISAMSGMADENAYEPGPMKVPVLAGLANSHPWPTDTEQFLRALAPRLGVHMLDDWSLFMMMGKPRGFHQALQAFLSKNPTLRD